MVLLVALVVTAGLAPGANATVTSLTIDDPNAPTNYGPPPTAVPVTFTWSENHMCGPYRSIVTIGSTASPIAQETFTYQPGVELRPIPSPDCLSGGGTYTMTHEIAIPATAPPGEHDLTVTVQENWPPGSGSWGFSQTRTVEGAVILLPSTPGGVPPSESKAAFESIRGTTPFSGGSITPLFSCSCECPETGTVNLANGQFVARACVLEIPADRGFPFTLQLTYRSQPPVDPPVGMNWDFSYNKRLEEDADGNVIRFNGEGREDLYRAEAAGAYASPPGFYDALTKLPDGSWTLRDRYGTMERYNQSGILQTITDRNDNTMTLQYDQGRLVSTIDTQDRRVDFTYNADGFIHRILDFAGRNTTFQYDAAGNLVSVTTPGDRTTTYTYDANHNLLTTTDPKGQTYLENTYDTEHRVIKQRHGQGNSTFTYDSAGNVTRVTDRNGNTVVWTFKSPQEPVPVSKEVLTNRDIRPTDPPAYVTLYEYNQNLERTRVIYPRGNSLQYVYDEVNPDPLQRGNLLAEIRLPVPSANHPDAGGPSSLVTTYTYEPVFNQVKTITRPRGNDPTFVPPNLGPATPERYTTTYLFDYEEAALGDLNGDGVTMQANGNVVQVIHPFVNPFGEPHPEFTPAFANQQAFELYTYNGFGQVLTHTDPEGNVEAYEYYSSNTVPQDPSDREGHLFRVTRDAGTGTDPNTGEPRLNIQATYTYDTRGNVLSETDGRGLTTTYEVNDRDKVTKITKPAPLSYETRLVYDSNDNVVERHVQKDTGAGFLVHTYAYDMLNNLVEETIDASRPPDAPASSRPTSLTTRHAYDLNENRVLIQHPEAVNGNQPNNVESFVYDERDLVFVHTRGGVTAQFKSLDANAQVDTSAITNSPHMTNSTYTYDENGNPILVMDGRGNPTRYEYDGFDRRTARVDALGNRFETAYDPDGNVVRTRALGPVDNGGPAVLLAQSIHHHDERGRAYRADRAYFDAATGAPLPDGPLTPGDGLVTTLTEFDRNNRAAGSLNDNAHATIPVYDGADRVHRVTDTMTNQVRYAYDGNHNVVTVIETEKDPAGILADETYTTTYAYDNVNRLVSVTEPGGNTTSYAYDGRDNLVLETDALGNTVHHVYDGANRKWADDHDLRAGGTGAGAVTGTIRVAYEWDANSRLTRMTDDNGNPTTYAYDDLNRRVAETFADGTADNYEYDANDNVAHSVDANGNAVNNTYDPLDRLVLREIARGPGVVGTTLQAFEYDGLSRLTLSLDDNDPADPADDSAVARHYDSLGRVVREVQNGHAVASRYDGVGNRLTLTYPNGRVVGTSYDPLERVDRIQDVTAATPVADLLIADYEYMGPRRVVQKTYGNGIALKVDYDVDRRVTQHRYLRPDNTVVVGFTHTHDAVHNKLTDEKLHDTAESELYAYDSIYRLNDLQRGTLNAAKDAIATPSPTALQRQEWTFDGVGNWDDTTTTTGGTATTETRTHSSLNELTGRTVSATTTPLAYDENGNLLDDGTFLFAWDFKNRLREVRFQSDGSPVAQYTYDAFDRRIQKTITATPGLLKDATRYLYDGWRVVEERDAIDRPTQQYLYGLYIDEPLALDRNLDGDAIATGPLDERLYYHQSTLYSVFALTNTEGATVEGYHYDAYGRQTVYAPGPNGVVDFGGDDAVTAGGTSAVGNPYMFTGQRFDPETRLYYYKMRYMDPEQGRFVSRDPIGIWTDTANLGNGYAYVGNAVVNLRDPRGLEADLPLDLSERMAELGLREAPEPVTGCDTITAYSCLGLSPKQVPRPSAPTLTIPPMPKPTPLQCCKIRELLKYEKEHGTAATARMFSNTWGSNPLGEAFNNRPIPTAAGTIDLDWYTDIQAATGTATELWPVQFGGMIWSSQPGRVYTYTVGKSLWWLSSKVGLGPPGVLLPFQDPKEDAALWALGNGYTKYSDLFPPEWLERNCPPGGRAGE